MFAASGSGLGNARRGRGADDERASDERDAAGLIDIGLRFGGTFYLTYHRFASREQLLRAYPQFPYFLAAKTQYDPDELFQSDWYEFYRRLFSEEIQLATEEQPKLKQRL